MLPRYNLLIASFLLVQSVSHAQYHIILERGDTLEVMEYYTKGDSLGFPGGRVAKRDVLCMTSGKHTYQFPLPGLGLSTTKLDETEPLCRRAALFGKKYAKAEPGTRVVDPMLDSLNMDEWLTCFHTHCPIREVEPKEDQMEGQLEDQKEKTPEAIEVASETGPLAGVSSDVDITSSTPLIVMRNGDTLAAPRGVTWIKDQIHFIGGGDVPRADVLMLVDLGGQHVFNERTGQKVKLKPQVKGLSPCALGVIYARIYWDSVNTTTEIPGITPSLLDDPSFSECFYHQQMRAQKKKDTMRTISTVIAVGSGGARMLKVPVVPAVPTPP